MLAAMATPVARFWKVVMRPPLAVRARAATHALPVPRNRQAAPPILAERAVERGDRARGVAQRVQLVDADPASAAISVSVGARSSFIASAFSARATLRWVRTRLIGSLIVRALASIPRSTAWRIHHVA